MAKPRRFGPAKHHDKGEYGRPGRQQEFLFGNGRKNASLHAHHCADKGVDNNQQCELGQVGPDSQSGRCCGHGGFAEIRITQSYASRKHSAQLAGAVVNQAI